MDHILEIISRDIIGESTDEEKLILKKWLEASDENKTFYKSYLYFVKGENQASEQDKDDVWKNVFSQIEPEKKTNTTHKVIQYNKASNKQNWFKYAASLTVLMLVGGLIYLLVGKSLMQEKADLILAQQNPVWEEKSIPAGKKMSFILPDGSAIKLNGPSSLRFQQNFNGTNIREVHLDGEAFFDVAKNPNKPFIIHTQYSEVKVLGTSFNVNAFPENDAVKVSVETGKVMVKKKENAITSDSITLVRGELALLKPAEKLVQKGVFNPDLPSWKDGVLVFEDASFAQIIKSLERWYGVEFIVNKEVNVKGGYNSTFKNQNLVNVLESIKYSLDFEYKYAEGRVIIN